MCSISVSSLRQVLSSVIEAIMNTVPLPNKDTLRMDHLYHEVDLLLLNPDAVGHQHAYTVRDSDGNVCGQIVLPTRNSFVDIPPVRTNGRWYNPRPLITLCPHDGHINTITFIHEVCHLFSCGEYLQMENRIIHRSGMHEYFYSVSSSSLNEEHEVLCVMKRTGSTLINEILTDLATIKILLSSMDQPPSLPEHRIHRVNNLLCRAEVQHMTCDDLIYWYFKDDAIAKESLCSILTE